MKKLLLALFLSAALITPLGASAYAEKIDFGKMTCGTLMELDEETVAMFYFWLDGYLSAKTNNTVLDTDTVEADLTALAEVCSANPNKIVLELTK